MLLLFSLAFYTKLCKAISSGYKYNLLLLQAYLLDIAPPVFVFPYLHSAHMDEHSSMARAEGDALN